MQSKSKKNKKAKPKASSQELKQTQKQKQEYLSAWQRCSADFLNYKKEEGERFQRMLDYQKEERALELLSILDHFERAKKGVTKEEKDSSVLEGFLQIQKYFESFLKKQGVRELKTEIGRKFEPRFEEVIETVEDKEKEEGTILEIIQKGYQYKEKIIRPTRVRVSSN